LYVSSNIFRVIKVRKMRWTGHVVCIVERRSAFKTLVRKPPGKWSCERLRNRWEGSIKINFEKYGKKWQLD
jgi:hypothetical protein